MKKIDFVSVLGAAIALAGCASYTPLQSNGATVTNSVEVLGRITVERETDESGYTILLEEASKNIPMRTMWRMLLWTEKSSSAKSVML